MAKRRRVCNVPGCPTISAGPKCPAHTPTTTERGYGSQHQSERAAWQRRIDSGEHITCWRHDCDTVITGRDWHLGHDDVDRDTTHGPECTACNISHAGRNSHMS